jgi:hypothetical protein
LGLVNERIGEKIVLNIFSTLLGVGIICALLGTITRMLLAPPKVWDDDDFEFEEIEASVNYNELRKQNPHIWID